MKAPRWTTVTESAFPWEREALDWLREQLPDASPWHAWSNLEFIDDDGKVNEVDLLVLAPGGLFLVEIKSRPGVLTGDALTWTWRTDGREQYVDNPLLLANRKCKRLASLLKHQPSFRKSRDRLPWIEPAIFLSASDLACKLEGPARARTYLRGRPGVTRDDGIVAALHSLPAPTFNGSPTTVSLPQAKSIVRALAEAGIRPSTSHRRVGDYELDDLLADTPNFQDWSAHHVAVKTRRRLRIYSFGKAANQDARAALARQARREFQVLEGVEHPGILKVLDFKDSDLGPTLLFEHDPDALRLDHFIQRHAASLDLGQRLQLLREVADTLRHAHLRRLYHRALSPSCVLVRESKDPKLPPRLQIMNWQTGSREPGATGSTQHTVGTIHLDDYVEDPARVYLAPEALHSEAVASAPLDVFALGATAYFILCGAAPAADTIEMAEKLRRGPGLKLSDALDGAPKSLQELISFSTMPDVGARFATVEEFLLYLDEAEDEITAPEPERLVDPSVARPNDRIGAGFTVIRQLGRGSSADALLVRRDDNPEPVVLKVASDGRHDERLIAEGETLRNLLHQNVVGFLDTLEIAGRRAVLLRYAGERTLGQRLRQEGRLSLDLLRRFGEELLAAVEFLELSGVSHRDIKPDNIGIAPVGERGMLHVVLFDFSLARTPQDNIQAGTPGYLDPFIRLRKPPRWDLYAERYAAAVTLYEMATGALPVWGDGRSAPEMLDCEASINADAFDPNLRDSLAEFFRKCLAREVRDRFDNAEDMRRAWLRAFDATRQSASTPDALDAIARLASGATTISELGYSVDAQNVLERMGIHNVRELLAVERVKFRYLSSVGDKVRKEIRLTAKRLAHLRPDLIPGRPTQNPDEPMPDGAPSIDELQALLVPKRPAGDDRPDDRAIALYLGLEPHETLGPFAALGEVARAAGVTRSQAGEALLQRRERWLKTPALTGIRDTLASIVQAQGGIMVAEEAARALLADRGSAEAEPALRLRLAAAVLRAALEAEQQRDDPRVQLVTGQGAPIVTPRPEWADYARRLGAAADRIAQESPLLAPATALAELERVAAPADLPALVPQRLLRLATAAAREAALSSRSEIYPRGMAIVTAIRQSLGALVGPRELTEADLAERIRGRYPEVAPLPGRPALDALLQEAGADLLWNDGANGGRGAFMPRGAPGPSVGSTTKYDRRPTRTVLPGDVGEEVAAARDFESRLEHVLRHGGFLALTMTPRALRPLQDELARRFAFEIFSLEEALIDGMMEQARSARVAPSVLLEADAAAPTSLDWRNLVRLATRAASQVATAVTSRARPVALTEPGLLARYDLMSLVTSCQAEAGRAGRTPTILLLVPMVQPEAPAIDGKVVPVITASQWARVPDAWLANRHRTAEPLPR